MPFLYTPTISKVCLVGTKEKSILSVDYVIPYNLCEKGTHLNFFINNFPKVVKYFQGTLLFRNFMHCFNVFYILKKMKKN